MQSDHLNPIATHLVASYNETAIYSRQFRDDYETPPSLMAKVHHLRSIVQARLADDDRFEVAAPYAEYGRVEFTELTTGSKFLLRSAGALAVEKAKQPDQPALFAFSMFIKISDVQLLVYEFGSDGLRLSLAAAAQRDGGKRLLASGEPLRVGSWPYAPDEEQRTDPFNQGIADPFGDVGDLDEGDDESDGAV